jgi:transposase-like protein
MIEKLKKLIIGIRLFFDAEICPQCGSENIFYRGFSGLNLRIVCKDCKKDTYVWWGPDS